MKRERIGYVLFVLGVVKVFIISLIDLQAGFVAALFLLGLLSIYFHPKPPDK